MATAHIAAEKGQIAKVVLMPGDPLRAKLFAEEYMEDITLVNDVRGMLAYTGKINGKEVTVMGHGMGLESIGIYAYELYNFFDVETIIRFGSAGAYDENINVLDFIIAEEAWTASNFGEGYGVDSNTLNGTPELVDLAENIAKEVIDGDRKIVRGKVNSSMWFYKTHNQDDAAEMVSNGISVVEMEAYSLYAIAKASNKKALTVLTVSDHIVTGASLSADDRRTKFKDMFKVVSKMATELA